MVDTLGLGSYNNIRRVAIAGFGSHSHGDRFFRQGDDDGYRVCKTAIFRSREREREREV